MKLLRIDSSPFGETTISHCLTDEFVEKWLTENDGGEIVRRDLGTIDIPAIGAAWVVANYTPAEARTCQQHQMLRLSAEFIRELAEADEYVIGMPMHNFGPPSRFKLWVDHIVTPSTLSERLLAGKRATFLIAAGRVYAPGSPDATRNHLVPWLRTLFESLGMTEIHFVIANGSRNLHSGKLGRTTFMVPHLRAISALFEEQSAVRAFTPRPD